MFNIDLNELAKRESERVEWKENVASIDDVVKTAVALSNDFSNLGGGYIVCGAKEGKDAAGFQRVYFEGLTSARLKEIENKVLADCREKVDPPIVLYTEELPTADPEKRVLVFVVPATDHAHSFRSSGKDASTYYIRVGRETREARNGLLRELLVRKKALDPWDRRIQQNASIEDIDLITLRDYLQTMGLWEPNKAIEDYLSAENQIATFVPPLVGKQSLTETLFPRNFTILMFCTRPTHFFPGAYAIFSVYPGMDRGEQVAERTEITGTVVDQARKLIERLNTESYTAFDKSSPHPNQQKYAARALQEAVVNAVVHRDYESDQPVRVTVFSDRIEINSPGSLPRVVSRERFVEGRATPFWRNQSLAYFFNKLQLAQAEGQGIPTMLRTMQEAGCPQPTFEIGEENVLCVLPAHPRHKQIRQLRQIENNIILGNHRDALVQLDALLKSDPYNYRSLELYCEVCNLLGEPSRVLDFLLTHQVQVESMNPACLIVVAETLLLVKDRAEAKELAAQLFAQASKSRLDEAEMKKVAIGIRKMGNDELAVQFINDAMRRIPQLATHASLLDIRAKAKIDLAKRCMDTARNSRSSPRIQAKAWDQCREYLSSAELDLNEALANSPNSYESEFVQRDLEFLKRLQSLARKPGRHRRG